MNKENKVATIIIIIFKLDINNLKYSRFPLKKKKSAAENW